MGSDILIAAQIVTEIGGIVDPTGICDGLNAAVLVAQGDKAGAAIALASIAVPFGVEKLAKAARRIPVGSLDELAGAVKQSADAVVKKVDDVAEESTELAAKAGANKAKALTKGPGECGVPGGNCFTPGHRIVIQGNGDSLAVVDENNREVSWAVGLLVVGGAMYWLRSQLAATGPNQRRSQRRRRGEWDEVLV